MKSIIISLSISLILIVTVTAYIENGDMKVVGLYLLFFFVPALILSILNGLLLMQLEKMPISVTAKLVISLIPVVVLVLLIFSDVSLLFLDVKASFVGLFGSIALGVSNIYWNYSARAKAIQIVAKDVLDDEEVGGR